MKYLVLLLIPMIALARPVTLKTNVNFVSSLTSTLALAKNKARQGLIISNKGQDAILVKFGASHSGPEGMFIPTSTAVEFTNPPMDSLYIKSQSSTGVGRVDVNEFE